ncbi:MAG: 23S rRNA (adenine(2503)-C(2))-methyltransferase RlmN [Mollicutes bacterium]|nr:23S rRNA (adenine(2503)-C(2))-methyltransferase RlmN [Mollicutes bacterium]
MESIYNLKLNDLENFLINNGGKKYQAAQVFDWLYKKRITKFKDMTNLNKETIKLLELNFQIDELEIVKKQSAEQTHKYLFKLSDGSLIEAVLMMHNYGNSICVSSQVGCNMGCLFCESGKLKKVRNLLPSEMILPILMIEKDLNLRISSVVIMGIGEPFDNYLNVIKFIEIINEPKYLSIGARHITVSTCGVVPKIKEFSDFPLQVNLAISFHAPDDKLRSELMKINKVYNIAELIDSIKEYILKTNRRVTIEYVMIDNVNDKDEQAKSLAKLFKGLNVYINLIPYNETSDPSFKKSKRIMQFYDILKKENINVTVRREFGGDIDAACGQLKAKEVNE